MTGKIFQRLLARKLLISLEVRLAVSKLSCDTLLLSNFVFLWRVMWLSSELSEIGRAHV